MANLLVASKNARSPGRISFAQEKDLKAQGVISHHMRLAMKAINHKANTVRADFAVQNC